MYIEKKIRKFSMLIVGLNISLNICSIFRRLTSEAVTIQIINEIPAMQSRSFIGRNSFQAALLSDSAVVLTSFCPKKRVIAVLTPKHH